MNVRSLTRLLAITAGGAAGAIGARTYQAFSRDLRAARDQACSGSRVVETACGPIECVREGEGPPVLVLHGILGGHDQGLLLTAGLAGDGFQVVAPSRFGYLRSPLPADASAAAQADAYAGLLDELRIRRAAVVAFSAGAPSALQFARRHLDRCSALVLVSAAVPRRTASIPTGWHAVAMKALLNSEFLLWLLFTRARRAAPAIVGVPHTTARRRLTAEDRAFVADLWRLCLPVRPRRPGTLNDLLILSADHTLPYERIAAPTLVVHAVDDRLASFEAAQDIATRIPGAQFVAIERGGHLMLGHREQARIEVARFVHARASAPIA
jgi:2-hydroxy-6-oxonona-2,4-dienedioate hydrolase